MLNFKDFSQLMKAQELAKMSYQNIPVSNKKWHFLTTLSSPDYILIFKYFHLLCCLFKEMSGMVVFICAFSYILNARTSLILTDMREGVDLMHQACLFLRAMCVLGVVNQDTSLGTVPLMGWVEESLHLNCINLNVRVCKEFFLFSMVFVIRSRRLFWKSLVFSRVCKEITFTLVLQYYFNQLV